MADTPPTQKDQISTLLGALGVSDFTAAPAVITQLRADAGHATAWAPQRQAMFASLGGAGDVPADYDFAAALAGMIGERAALWTALGASDQATAIAGAQNLRQQVTNFEADRMEIFGALKVTDKAAALTAITDIDGRVKQGVIAQAAAAGVQTPVKKDPVATAGANVMARSEFNKLAPAARSEFSRKGGKLTDE